MTPNFVNQVLNSTIDVNSYLFMLVDQEKTQDVEDILLCKELHSRIDMEFRQGVLLRTACSKNNVKLVSLLLTHPHIKPAQIKNEYKNSIFNPLVTACYAGHLDVVKFLLEEPSLSGKYDINAQNNTAIKFAINQNHQNVVQYLLTGNIAKNIKIEKVYSDLISLLSYNIQYNNYGTLALSQLLDLCEQKQIDLTQYQDEAYGTTILDIIAQCNDIQLTERIFPLFDKYPYLQEQAVRHSVSQKAFQSAYYMMVQKGVKFFYDKSKYSDKDIIGFLEKYELYEKYTKENTDAEKGNGEIRKI